MQGKHYAKMYSGDWIVSRVFSPFQKFPNLTVTLFSSLKNGERELIILKRAAVFSG